MKKLLLLIFLMTISLGQAQTFPLDFSDAADLIPGVDGVTTSIVQDNSNSVLQIVGSTGTWDNCQVTLAQNINLSDNANNTITFRFKSTGALTSGQHLLKFEGGTGGAAVAEGFFNATGSEWQTITIDFGAGLGIYSKLVIFTDSGASSNGYNNTVSGTYLIDDIAGGTNVVPVVVPAPAVSATSPTSASKDVISIFSGAYTDVASTNFNPGWGQATVYTPFAVSGNNMLKYSNLNYQGIEFATGLDVSAMTTVHLDLWTADCSSFQFFLIGGGENSVTLTPSLSGWNSFDIPLTSYSARTLNNIIQFKLVGNGTVYLDNIYFWKVPAGTNTYYADTDGDGYGAGAVFLSTATTAPSGYSVNKTDCNDSAASIHPGATELLNGIDDNCNGLIDEGLLPTIPPANAPTPIARNAWDVQSVYSAAYTNYSGVLFFPDWGQSTTFSNYTPVNDATLKYSNLTYQGIDFNGSKNISAMTKLHLDVWTPDITSFKVWLIAGGDNAVTLTPTQSGWNSFDIDLATQYAGRNLTAAIQLKLERTLWTPTDGNVNSLYLDNIYFYRPATTQPPTLGTFTVPAKVVGNVNFQLTAPTSNSTGAFTYTSSNTAVATISGTTVTILGAGSSTITATQAAAGTYAAISVIATLEVSLAAAAPTPTVPSDRVLSVFSDAYSSVSGTQWRPSWGQATLYNLVNVVNNPTVKYSNLSFEGVQLETPLDVNSYTNLHIDIYGAGTSAVNFFVINQDGGAGSPLKQIEASTPLTLLPGVWNSFDIALSSLTGLELNRVGQFKFEGSGTIYIDNIYFSKSAASHTTAPTVANISYCKGATASTLTATASGTNLLKWYSTATIATALTAAPKPVTTTVGTKSYYVAQVMSDGFVSPRATITVTVLDLPTEVLGAITGTTTGTTADDITGIYAAATKAVGPYVNTTTTVSYRVPAFTTGLSYYWTVPTGVSIVGQADGVTSVTQEGVNANILNVNFKKVSSELGSAGSITVQAQNASGCLTTAKASVALTKALPTAPAAIVMTDALTVSATTGLPTAVTSFAKYMGRTTELTLTATAAATATSYIWELPTGVYITKSSATTVGGVTSSTSNVITVNFFGVTSSNTHKYSTTADVPVLTNVVRIGVKSVNGVGISTTANTTLANSSLDFYPNTTSTAKLLSLTAIAPATPGAITASTANVCSVVGTSTNVTYSVASVTNAYANSYTWTVPTGASIIGSATGNSISVSYSSDYVAAGAVTVSSSNGVGTSAAKSLAITRLLPVAPATVTGQIAGVCGLSTYDYSFTAGTNATSYTITGPTGSKVRSVSSPSNNSNVLSTSNLAFSVYYPSGYVTGTIVIASSNGCATSVTGKSITVAKAMAAVASIGGGTTYSSCNQTFTTPAVLGATTYTWTVPAGATIKSGIGTNSVVVNYGSLTGSQTIKVMTTNSCGLSSAVKSIALTSGACPSNARLSQTSNVSVTGMYPNPTADSFHLELSATKSADVSVTVYSFDGIVVSTKNVQLSEGTNVLNEDLSSQREGIYLVKIIDSTTGLETIKKIIKQ